MEFFARQDKLRDPGKYLLKSAPVSPKAKARMQHAAALTWAGGWGFKVRKGKANKKGGA